MSLSLSHRCDRAMASSTVNEVVRTHERSMLEVVTRTEVAMYARQYVLGVARAGRASRESPAWRGQQVSSTVSRLRTSFSSARPAASLSRFVVPNVPGQRFDELEKSRAGAASARLRHHQARDGLGSGVARRGAARSSRSRSILNFFFFWNVRQRLIAPPRVPDSRDASRR